MFFDSTGFRENSKEHEWQQEVFARAFCTGPRGPFQRVCTRLRSGFSVLVYLPGNCIFPAAGYVKSTLGKDWIEHGQHDGTSLSNIWSKASNLVPKLDEWLQGKKAQNAIYHNLDLLGDGQGRVYPSEAAQGALFSIVEGTRKGVVLGLADSAAGRLPTRIESAFGEISTLDEIPMEAFPHLIPTELAPVLKGSRASCVPQPVRDGRIWLLASRLRWTDPIRAVTIMSRVGANQTEWDELLSKIWEATRSIDFTDPESDPIELRGVPESVTETLSRQVIAPFKNWLNFAGDSSEAQSRIKRLPTGLILHGPPGTGKTYLARWLSQMLALPVRLVSGADIKAGPWGDAERNLVRVFEEAKRAAPCVVVFDDADDLFPDRNRAKGVLASAEQGLVDSALQQLQGFAGRPTGVLFVLTTNRLAALDPAIRGRLPLHLRIPFLLDETQIGEVLDVLEKEFCYQLTKPIRARLIERFMRPVASDDSVKAPSSVSERNLAHSNLFSPREIQLALQLLENPDGGEYVDGEDGQRLYRPSDADVDNMIDYYERLAKGKDPAAVDS